MIKTTLIFDFDGTIINTNQLIEEGLNVFAKTYRGSELTKEEHKFMLGRPLEEQMRYINEDAYLAMTEIFKLWYLKEHNHKTTAFDGMEALIRVLYYQNYQLAIVSNNSRETVMHGLKHLNLTNYFDLILTCDDVQEKKPSPEGLYQALFRLNATMDEVLFIGDSSNDILAAKAANVDSVLVGWTMMERAEMAKLNATHIIHHPSELLVLLENKQKVTA